MPAFAVRDSAGIAIAENRGPEAAAEPALSDTVGRALDLGELLYVQRMLPIGETALLLGGGSAGALQRIDLTSGEVKMLGRSGQGPGEYSGVGGFFPCGTDTLMVRSYPGRISWLDTTGVFIRLLERPAFRRDVSAIAPDCSAALLVSAERPVINGQDISTTLTVAWYDFGADASSQMATLPGPETEFVPFRGTTLPFATLFGEMPVYTAEGDLAYLSSSRTPEIRVFDRTGGLVRIIRWDVTVEPVVEADIDRYDGMLDELTRMFGPEEVADLPRSAAYDVPRTKPLFSRMLVDRAGNLWVQRYTELWDRLERNYGRWFGRQPLEWWVFNSEGRLLGLYSTPRSLYIHAISREQVFGIRTDSLDLEHVTVLPLAPALRGTPP